MKIQPRYGTDPLITYEDDPAAVAAPAVRQRLRLARTLAGFGSQEWEAPSRCARWTNRDVVVHLASTNRFWVHSISQARRGTPSQVLATFDPVATPAGLVAAAGNPPPAEVLDAYVKSAHTLADLLGSLTSGEWTMLGESPLGHVSVSAMVRHALWDAWVHERDITLGIGLVPAVEADEVDAALRCAARPRPGFRDPPRRPRRSTARGDRDDPGPDHRVHHQGRPGSPDHRGHGTGGPRRRPRLRPRRARGAQSASSAPPRTRMAVADSRPHTLLRGPPTRTPSPALATAMTAATQNAPFCARRGYDADDQRTMQIGGDARRRR